MQEKYLEYSKEVANAIEKNMPLVALESTIISHGMPYPENVETALNCQKIIREHGAVPATTRLRPHKVTYNNTGVATVKNNVYIYGTYRLVLPISRQKNAIPDDV